jgi:putative heme-binding domain-containing protein
MRSTIVFSIVFVGLLTAPSYAQPLVAETPPLTPAEEQKKFHLPPGFEIQLVAEEPDVHKPMNMKFDVHGRLWITHSLEYPFPAKSDDAARDAISIFSDFAPDGKARKVERFAEHLNIPIGVLPLSDVAAITWTIPNICRLEDTNGDGVADKKTVLFGPFGVTDTHGDQNAFTRWIDGWVYANHGFANDSHVKMAGTGPDVLHMNSGNTYRFRPNGSAIEQYSWGQVNPFGLSFDPLGNLFSADCHSCAVTMLLREGYYQSFGKPHDGLGYAPEITHIDHGGTGIAGVVYSTLPNFPREYRDVLFVGNVITTRIHCDRLKWIGSTPVVEKVEDFLTSDDPWFRPVDIQPGPDGSLYVADFYNCIIGHYEVPLTHPKRDRERGRIWRIVYKGESKDGALAENARPMPDLTPLDAPAVFKLLTSPNQTTRVLATNYLLDRFPKEAAALATNLLTNLPPAATTSARDTTNESQQACHAVWMLQRTAGLSEPIAHKLLSTTAPGDVQVHTAKALGETAKWQPWHFDVVRAAIVSGDPFVRRAAAEALSKHPASENISPLLEALNHTDKQDAQLYHQIRIALRDQLRSPAIADQLLTLKLPPAKREQLVAFAATAPTGPAAVLIFDEALHGRIDDEILAKALPSASRYVDATRVDAMVDNIHQRFAGDLFQEITLLRALAEGMSERGLPLTAKLSQSLSELIQIALADDTKIEWFNTPLDGKRATPSPWAPQQRAYRDGSTVVMISSLPSGEQQGGVLHSPIFKLPAKLSFWLCGHDGLPNEPARKENYVRLVLEDGTEVARSSPPRDDIARRVDWDLSSHVGHEGHIEVVDGITDLTGFAWIAASRFEPAVVRVPDHAVGEAGSTRTDLLHLAGQLKLSGLEKIIAATANAPNENLNIRLGACESLVMLTPERAVPPLTALLVDSKAPTAVRERAAQQLGQIDRKDARDVLLAQLKSAPESVAVIIGAGLAARQDSAADFLQQIRNGTAPAGLLTDPTIVDRLKSCGLPDIENQIHELTAGLGPTDHRITKLIADRRAGFLAGHYSADTGRGVFAKSVCANCHRVGDVGKTIGPALDGIGNRGLDRLLEDTLDPSRNVDLAFRSVTIETANGQVLTGFSLREEGANLVFNDSTGQQVRVPLADIDSRTQSTLSPMPANVIEQMPPDDYYALLAYLLSQKGK